MIKINTMNSPFEKYFVKTNYIYKTISPVKIKINLNKFNNNNYKYDNNQKDVKYIHYDDPMHSQK